MRKLTGTLFLSILGYLPVQAQDLIVFTDNKEQTAYITEINNSRLFYRLDQEPTSVLYSTEKANVKIIRFADGTELKPDVAFKPLNSDPQYQLGQFHAREYYKGKTVKFATFVASATLPPLGLATAITFANVPPQQENMLSPDYELHKNNNYRTGYVHEAKRIRQRKAWVGFGLGCLTSAVIYSVVGKNLKDK